MKVYQFVFGFLILGLGWCGTKNSADLLLGTWETAIFMDAQKAKEVFQVEDGIDMEFTVSGESQYLRGGRYNSQANMTIRVLTQGQEIVLRFLMKDVGTWQLDENYLIEISENAEITPLDEVTQNLMREAPEFKAMIEPVKGQAYNTEILNLTPNTFQGLSESMPGYVITFNKKRG